MRLYLCIDDTDNLESRGTGELASLIIERIEMSGWGNCSKITRHQLFVHPDVPYTSHNSSMCFEAELKDDCEEKLTAFASEFLSSECAAGSDPGLCIAAADRIKNPEKLISFGQRAQRMIVKKTEAYDLAREMGVHLSEHGGTGDGVIGALAGVGLRMGGNDGRFKGRLELGSGTMDAGHIRAHTFIQSIKEVDGPELPDREKILINDSVKMVLLDGKPTLLVCRKTDGETGEWHWEPCTMHILKKF